MSDKPRRPGLSESLLVMDIADRLRRREDRLDQASDLSAQRRALRERLRDLYARQGIEVAERTLDQAIDKRLAQRLTHRPARGVSAALARFYVRLYNRFK